VGYQTCNLNPSTCAPCSPFTYRRPLAAVVAASQGTHVRTGPCLVGYQVRFLGTALVHRTAAAGLSQPTMRRPAATSRSGTYSLHQCPRTEDRT
jgi:hypothetical protein